MISLIFVSLSTRKKKKTKNEFNKLIKAETKSGTKNFLLFHQLSTTKKFRHLINT